MEQTAPSIAILPARWLRQARAQPRGGEVVTFPRDRCRLGRAAPRRVTVIDPFPVERRLLTALSEAQGHAVLARCDVEGLLATPAWAATQIAFVHVCCERALREAVAEAELPPIVLIDPYSLGTGGIGPAPELGLFPTLRFPIGLNEVAAAIERNAR